MTYLINNLLQSYTKKLIILINLIIFKENFMLLDVRTYTCKPGTIKTHLNLYEEKGKPVQSKHLGQPLLFATTETGNPNEYTHIWVYKSADDREKKRAAMWADPDWINYTQESAQLGALESQQNKLLKPVDFYQFNPK